VGLGLGMIGELNKPLMKRLEEKQGH